MDFKEMIEEDIHEVFLDLDEFADIHDVDGREIPAIIDDTASKQRNWKASDNVIDDGVFRKIRKLYVAKQDFGERPSAGARIFHLDGKPYLVRSVDEDDGVYQICLEVAKGR